jgi:hypothetical protein
LEKEFIMAISFERIKLSWRVYSEEMAKKIGHFNVVIEPLSKADYILCRWIS